jgi:hypothetical protein
MLVAGELLASSWASLSSMFWVDQNIASLEDLSTTTGLAAIPSWLPVQCDLAVDRAGSWIAVLGFRQNWANLTSMECRLGDRALTVLGALSTSGGAFTPILPRGNLTVHRTRSRSAVCFLLGVRTFTILATIFLYDSHGSLGMFHTTPTGMTACAPCTPLTPLTVNGAWLSVTVLCFPPPILTSLATKSSSNADFAVKLLRPTTT